MVKINPWKIGIGVGATLLGAYIALTSQGNFVGVIAGIAIAAFGISLIASN
ncbi:MAG: hypothetical protein KKA64_01550 [Nanoarchaeota archaeon]|nr:hypothetical protein [Nanoarchaeota archaeon]